MKDAEKTASSSLKNIKNTANGTGGVLTKIGNAASSAATAMKGGFSGVASTLAKIGPIGIAAAGAITLIGTAVFGVFNAIGKLTTKLDSIGKAAKSVNMSAEAYQSLQHACNRAGIQMDNVLSIIGKIDYAMVHAVDGEKKYRDAFYSIGLTWEELERLSPEQQFVRIANAIAKVKAEGKGLPKELYNVFSKKDLQTFAKASDNGFGKAVAEAKGLGYVIDERMIKNAERYRDAVGDTQEKLLAMVSNMKTMETITSKLAIGWKYVSDRIGKANGMVKPEYSKDFIGMGNIAKEMLRKNGVGAFTREQKEKILQGFYGSRLVPDPAFPRLQSSLSDAEIDKEFEKAIRHIDWENLKTGLRQALFEVVEDVERETVNKYGFKANDKNTWIQARQLTEQDKIDEKNALKRSKVNSELTYYNNDLEQAINSYDSLNNKAKTFVDANKEINRLTAELQKQLKDNDAQLDEQLKHQVRINAAKLNQKKLEQEIKDLGEKQVNARMQYYSDLLSTNGADKGMTDILLGSLQKVAGADAVNNFINANAASITGGKSIDELFKESPEMAIYAFEEIAHKLQNNKFAMPFTEQAMKDIAEASNVYNEFAKNNGLAEILPTLIKPDEDIKSIDSAIEAFQKQSEAFNDAREKLVERKMQYSEALSKLTDEESTEQGRRRSSLKNNIAELDQKIKALNDEEATIKEALDKLQQMYAPVKLVERFKEMNEKTLNQQTVKDVSNILKARDDAEREADLADARFNKEKEVIDLLEKKNLLQKLGVRATKENVEKYDEFLTSIIEANKQLKEVNTKSAFRDKNENAKNNLDLQVAMLDMNTTEMDNLKRINALKQLGVEATEQNLKTYKKELDMMLKLEKQEKNFNFNKSMIDQAESLRWNLLEKTGQGRQATYERLYDQMEKVTGKPLNEEQFDQVQRLANLMYDIQNMSIPTQLEDNIISNELASRGGFASSVAVDKRDNSDKILSTINAMNTREEDILGIIRDIHNNKL